MTMIQSNNSGFGLSEICLKAGRRIGELIPKEKHGGKREKGQVQNFDLKLPIKQQMSEYHKLAEIPDDKFEAEMPLTTLKQRYADKVMSAIKDYHRNNKKFERKTQ